MSYARWSEGDVYIYRGTDGMYHCMCCPFMPTHKKRLFWTASEIEMHGCFSTGSGQEMLKHMKKHQEAGHEVPSRALEQLEEELKDESENRF